MAKVGRCKSSDVEKMHSVASRSTFESQNVQNMHFWKLRCRKRTRRSGLKRVSKQKCAKHVIFRLLLEIEISKMCKPFWCEVHVQVTCTKHVMFKPLLEVEMSKECTPLWRDAHKHAMFKPLWKLRCRKSERCCGAKHVSKSK